MKFENLAHEFCEAIKAMADNEYSIDNFESYLSYHFDKWLEMWANTPENITAEIKHFASISE